MMNPAMDAAGRATVADAKIVALARESRAEALQLIYAAHKVRIYTFLLRLLADPAAADDLTQDVFTKAYQALGSLTSEHRVLPWLYRIATNTAIDHIRRRKRFTWLRVGRLAGTREEPLMKDAPGSISANASRARRNTPKACGWTKPSESLSPWAVTRSSTSCRLPSTVK